MNFWCALRENSSAAGLGVDGQHPEVHLVEGCRVQCLLDRMAVDGPWADASCRRARRLNRNGEQDREAPERAFPLRRSSRSREECRLHTRESAAGRDLAGGESGVLLHGSSERARRRVSERERRLFDRATVAAQIGPSPQESSPEQERLRGRQAVVVQRGDQATRSTARRGRESFDGGVGRGVVDRTRHGA